MQYIIDFDQTNMQDIARVGGKNASLGEMIQHLTPLGILVPKGFAILTSAYHEFLAQNKLTDKIYQQLSTLDGQDTSEIQKISSHIHNLILTSNLPDSLVEEIKMAYEDLDGNKQLSYAVRSSATAEDLPHASFAGQQETFLNISGIDNILAAVKKVYASLFSERAISYRIHHHFPHQQVAISVGIQRMVRSDQATSGVIFTIDTESGFDQVIFITGTYGLGEALVQGIVNPDEFYVHKPMLKENHAAIISRKLGSKNQKMIYETTTQQKNCLELVAVSEEEQARFCLSDADILALAKQAQIIEQHYGKAMDIEWAKDGMDQKLYIVQARPETVEAHRSHQFIESFLIKEKGPIKVTGRSIGRRIGQGIARLVSSAKQMDSLQKGEVLVTEMTDPDWEPIMKKASAIVTNRGGRTCHAAIVARELGIPAVVGCGNATQLINNDEAVTVSCAEGEQGYVYSGLLPYEIEKTEIDKMPNLPVKICLNLANPDQAFSLQFLPNDGIGLARIEFIISNIIGVHPNALLNFSELPNSLQEEISKKTSAYASPIEFYIEKLAESIGTIAAAFYPKPIIVRFSDFKSNEYANLLGGDLFEPHEENPMLGYRGASRYIDKNFVDCFSLECQAIVRVREIKGLVNTHLMFPFVRTVGEVEQLIPLLKNNGLERGKNGLQLYMMCEIPANALLAEDFLQYFDGFSIGSNDLTQLTLGLDRDSGLIAHLFDERNAAVKVLLHQAIKACKQQNKYVGICGQGPSDHPELAKWLMQEGINAISLNPDSVISTWLQLAKLN